LCLLPRDQEDHDRDCQNCETSRTEKYVCLLLPDGESGGGIDSDRYYNWEMGEAVSGQQAILPSNLADEASRTTIAGAYSVDGRFEKLPDGGLDLRISRQQNSVTAKQGNRAACAE
jgi:hypothetical protein